MEFITVNHVQNGYLITPLSEGTLDQIYYADDVHTDHLWGFPEYAYYDADVYPDMLWDLAKAGIMFGWEYMLTEDFSYYAYNFPTEDSKNNLVQYRTGRRKGLPRLTKKMSEYHNNISAVNELLFKLGLNNGKN